MFGNLLHRFIVSIKSDGLFRSAVIGNAVAVLSLAAFGVDIY